MVQGAKPFKRRWTISLAVVLAAALLPAGVQAFDWPGVALKFLRRHAVPCGAIAKVVSVLGADVATCRDGREWALFWVEDEVALIDARTRRLYRWEPDVYGAYPQLYGSSAPDSQEPEGSGP